MQLKYGLDDRLPFGELILFGLQWFAVAVPSIIIIGKITGGCHFANADSQIIYLQKMAFVTGVTLVCQVLWGHRMPIILGPATVLLIGVIASRRFPIETIYTSIFCGGLVLFFLSVSGLFGYLKRLFTARVVTVVLLLIAFTLSPTVLNLITVAEPRVVPPVNAVFALALTCAMLFLYRILPGILRATLIIWSMLFGSIAYFVLFPETMTTVTGSVNMPPVSLFFSNVMSTFAFDMGVLVAFMFCFMALSINDLGSIQAMNELLKPSQTTKRITRGVTVTGLANVLAGFLGVIGPVNYSMSPGVIVSTKCASRYAMLPAGLVLLGLAFSPMVLAIIGSVPPPIIGAVFIYILCSQVVAGWVVARESAQVLDVSGALIIGLPILLGTVIAFLPEDVIGSLPSVLRPLLGNGFVMGVIAALLFEHIVFRK